MVRSVVCSLIVVSIIGLECVVVVVGGRVNGYSCRRVGLRGEVLLLLDNLASGGVNLLAITGNAVDVVSDFCLVNLL